MSQSDQRGQSKSPALYFTLTLLSSELRLLLQVAILRRALKRQYG